MLWRSGLRCSACWTGSSWSVPDIHNISAFLSLEHLLVKEQADRHKLIGRS